MMISRNPKLYCFTLLSKAAKKRRLSQAQPKKLVKKLRLSSPKFSAFVMTGTHCTYFLSILYMLEASADPHYTHQQGGQTDKTGKRGSI